MKRSFILALFLFSVSFALADACDLSVTLLNQDPYPAIPGEYVKLVFQVEGIDSPDCGDITFELIEDYPIIFDPTEQAVRTFKKVNYVKDYDSTLIVPYEVRVDENAIDSTAPLEVKVQSKGDAAVLRTLYLEVDDIVSSFEVYVKNYDYLTRELTVEVLNIGGADIEALTVEIPKQEKIQIKGSNRVVVGDLDSNEYTSADFEAIPTDGLFEVNLIYSDSIDVRRTVNKEILFDSSYFTERIKDQKKTSNGTYVLLVLVVLVVVWIIYGKIKKARKKKNKL